MTALMCCMSPALRRPEENAAHIRTVAHRRDSPQLGAVLVKKMERRSVQAESSAIWRNVRCSESLRSSDSVSVWAIEFSTRSSRLRRRISYSACFLSGDIEDKSLIRAASCRIPHGRSTTSAIVRTSPSCAASRIRNRPPNRVLEQSSALAVDCVGVKRAVCVMRHQVFARIRDLSSISPRGNKRSMKYGGATANSGAEFDRPDADGIARPQRFAASYIAPDGGALQPGRYVAPSF